MAELMTGSDISQFAASLHLVRSEIEHALDHAAVQLDNYSDNGDSDSLKAFLDEIRQLRGTFKMLDFRAGERLCEELTESVRLNMSGNVVSPLVDACTQSVLYLKRYIEFVMGGQPVAPSLLIPTINMVRRARGDKGLPEGYFFSNSLHPRLTPSAVEEQPEISYRRVRQMMQLGLLGLIRGAGRHGPLQVILRAVRRIENASKGTPSWPFWHLVIHAVDVISLQDFEITPLRIQLIGELDRQVKQLQDTSGQSFNNKAPDWLQKEYLHLIALGEPDSTAISDIHVSYQLVNHIREKDLARSRQNLSGPDQSALLSFARALQDEIEFLKDTIDRNQRNPDIVIDEVELIERLEKISDTLLMVDMDESAARADSVIRQIRNGQSNINLIADDIIQIEQDVHALTQSKQLQDKDLIDPVTLREGTISVVSESVTSLVMVKRSVASYVDSSDKIHVKNVGKSLHDVSGAVVFLEKPELRTLLLELEDFIRYQVIETKVVPSVRDMEAFADAVTAIEYFLDTIDNPSAGATDALSMAKESVERLRSGYVAN